MFELHAQLISLLAVSSYSCSSSIPREKSKVLPIECMIVHNYADITMTTARSNVNDGSLFLLQDPIYQVLENTNKSPILTYPSTSTFCPVPAMDGSISELIPPLSQSDYAEIT